MPVSFSCIRMLLNNTENGWPYKRLRSRRLGTIKEISHADFHRIRGEDKRFSLFYRLSDCISLRKDSAHYCALRGSWHAPIIATYEDIFFTESKITCRTYINYDCTHWVAVLLVTFPIAITLRVAGSIPRRKGVIHM